MTRIFIFEFKSWTLVFSMDFAQKRLRELQPGKIIPNLNNALSSSSSQTDGKNKETIDHRGELIMKKSRYSLALHPESW